MTPDSASRLLATWAGTRVLGLLCAVAFLDFVDASITNVALPHIRAALKLGRRSRRERLPERPTHRLRPQHRRRPDRAAMRQPAQRPHGGRHAAVPIAALPPAAVGARPATTRETLL